ncbi:MAG: DUF423 domain-containing protein [Chitinophagales bacterium]
MTVQKSYIIWGTIFLLLAVVLGAFGAHGLQSIVDASHIATFKTGVQYQFYHGFAILLLAILAKQYKIDTLKYCFYFFVIGIFLFSGSLYLLTFSDVINIPKIVGPLTPIGGFCFIVGWGVMLVSFVRK